MSDDLINARRQLREAVERSNAARLRLAAEVRAGGRPRYVCRYALARLWLPAAAAAAAGFTLLAPTTEPPAFGSAPRLVAWLAIFLPLGAAIGVPWGLWMWRGFERHWFPLLDADSGGPGAGT